MTKERLDKVLVQRGLVSSRERARSMILAGQVVVDDHRVDKVGAQISTLADIRLKGDDIPYVSRGGLKLEKALNEFSVDVTGRIALDVGASTGGFTDCLLQHGSKKVYAVDVGYGQLAWKLREDPRVINLERCNIRHLDSALLAEIPDLAVVDASFISLSKILLPTLDLLSEQGEVLALIKPQFEVGRNQVGKGGIVKDRDLQEAVVQNVCDLAVQLNCHVLGVIESPILGQKGNREFLIYLKKN
jgi:23S rRNA (cytidine1920-2'-O)/16S rRNA (cytidine1409-2'-O)-methyltransferase